MPWGNPNSYHFNAVSIIASVPAQSGVYALYNANQWIYIGESEDIRARLLQHVNGDNDCITRWAPPSISFELVPTQAGRVARQNQLILELRPACNQRLG